jgi:hypothetical protein
MTEKYSKWSYNITTFSIPKPSKFLQDFWFENKTSGNPAPGVDTVIASYDPTSSLARFENKNIFFYCEKTLWRT